MQGRCGGMQPFVRGGGTGWEVPSSAVGESKAQGGGKDGHRSELQRRPDAGPSASALLRALRALRNPAFPAPLDLRLSKPLHSHLPPCSPASHPLRVLSFLHLHSHILGGETPAPNNTRNVSLLFLIYNMDQKVPGQGCLIISGPIRELSKGTFYQLKVGTSYGYNPNPSGPPFRHPRGGS